MRSFVPSNVLICGILNFSRRGKCSTPMVNGDSVCCTRASMETRARPFTASFMWLISCWMSLNLYSHDLSSLRSSPGGLVRILLPGVASFSFSIHFSTRVEVLLFSGNKVLVFLGMSCLLGASYFPSELFQLFQQVLVGDAERLHLVRVGLHSL